MDQKNIDELYPIADGLEIRFEPAAGEAPNRLVGYAARFNSLSADLGGFKERLLPGAFRDSITGGSDIRALVGHDPAMLLGRTSNKTLRVAEDEQGLRVEIDLPATSYAADIRELVGRGDIKGMSFGFRVRDGGQKFTTEGGTKVRELSNVNLHEVSVVANPAYAATSVQLRVDPAVVAQARHAGETPELAKRRQVLRRHAAEIS